MKLYFYIIKKCFQVLFDFVFNVCVSIFSCHSLLLQLVDTVTIQLGFCCVEYLFLTCALKRLYYFISYFIKIFLICSLEDIEVFSIYLYFIFRPLDIYSVMLLSFYLSSVFLLS